MGNLRLHEDLIRGLTTCQMHPHYEIAHLPVFANVIIALVGFILVPIVMTLGPLLLTLYWYFATDDVIPKLIYFAP